MNATSPFNILELEFTVLICGAQPLSVLIDLPGLVLVCIA